MTSRYFLINNLELIPPEATLANVLLTNKIFFNFLERDILINISRSEAKK